MHLTTHSSHVRDLNLLADTICTAALQKAIGPAGYIRTYMQEIRTLYLEVGTDALVDDFALGLGLLLPLGFVRIPPFGRGEPPSYRTRILIDLAELETHDTVLRLNLIENQASLVPSGKGSLGYEDPALL